MNLNPNSPDQHHIQFADQVFIRAAAMSFQGFSYRNVQKVLNDPAFRLAIQTSSPSLYEELMKADFTEDYLSQRVLYSIRKYYNRISFRATPFGLFAMVGTAGWSAEPLRITSRRAIAQLDAPTVLRLAKQTAMDNELFFLNPTLLRHRDSYRFFKIVETDGTSTSLELSEIYSIKYLAPLFNYLSEPRTRSDIIRHSASVYSNAEDLIRQLIAEGVLIGTLTPDLHCSFENSQLYRQLMYSPLTSPELKRIMFQRSGSGSFWPVPLPQRLADTQLYFTINQQMELKGGLSGSYKASLLDGLYALEKLCRNIETGPLSDFRKAFKARYDQEPVPLLKALDPGLGIPYDQLSGDIIDDDLEILRKAPSKETLDIRWNEVSRLLLNKLRSLPAGSVLELQPEELQHLPSNNNTLPASFNVFFSPVGEMTYITHAGGASSNSITGRFTIYDESLSALSRRIAQHEQDSNPELAFAEVYALTDPAVAEINTRKNSYAYAIPVLLPPYTDTDFRNIALEDLYLSESGEGLVLWSRKLGKEVIPRFSTAYNYRRHQLPLIRFLYDLQHQRISSNLVLNLDTILPGLDDHPRIVYQKCILSPARWFIRSKELEKIQSAPTPLIALRLYLKERLVPDLVKLCDHDQTLTFDLRNEEDLTLMLSVIKGKASTELKEVIESSIIRDENGLPLAAEFIVPVINTGPAAHHGRPGTVPSLKHSSAVRSYLPGEQWLYYKFYGTPFASEKFLSESISKLIFGLKKRGLIDQWHFIRYRDPEPHIRLRIKSSAAAADMIALLNPVIKSALAKGQISTMYIESYVRELERYGYLSIEAAEKAFTASSDIVLKFLSGRYKGMAGLNKLQLCLLVTDRLLARLAGNSIKKLEFVTQAAAAMAREFDLQKPEIIRMDKQFRLDRAGISATLERGGRQHLEKTLITDIVKSFDAYAEINPENTNKFMADIIHLFNNRIWADGQREREFQCYRYLSKYYAGTVAKEQSIASK